ncbi:antitoxin Xre/MbcA/ParS toxin-binding domain-containing protein [Roseomonas sp. KE0001]|uniref:type II RES/Xre toxin-antitoxin system antitoxin n=1 Tax=Roseomonas sp. KE0001 TaxID=2479201 RepID=UPI0018DFDA9E|nr:antitoxin Xre/MbcA/ParS toxin-binding domain-containing protein [Roseomonas sp. KE0001]MBI0436175.1 DUF2384 domain-containing protein [Roseomonas sp. KE0001]
MTSAAIADRPKARRPKAQGTHQTLRELLEVKVSTGTGKTWRIYTGLYRAEPLKRIRAIKSGLLAAEAKEILADLHLSQTTAMKALALSPATMNRKAKGADRLPPAESERVLGMARLVGQVQAMVEESGNSEGFDAAEWVSRWLSEPLPALGGAKPLDFLDTMEGQALVSSMLARMQSGTYA